MTAQSSGGRPELPRERVAAIAYFAAVAGPACVAVERMRARKAAA